MIVLYEHQKEQDPYVCEHDYVSTQSGSLYFLLLSDVMFFHSLYV